MLSNRVLGGQDAKDEGRESGEHSPGRAVKETGPRAYYLQHAQLLKSPHKHRWLRACEGQLTFTWSCLHFGRWVSSQTGSFYMYI